MQSIIKLSHQGNTKQLCGAKIQYRDGGGGQIIKNIMQRNCILFLLALGVMEGF